jgi:hypothetical protein
MTAVVYFCLNVKGNEIKSHATSVVHITMTSVDQDVFKMLRQMVKSIYFSAIDISLVCKQTFFDRRLAELRSA